MEKSKNSKTNNGVPLFFLSFFSQKKEIDSSVLLSVYWPSQGNWGHGVPAATAAVFL